MSLQNDLIGKKVLGPYGLGLIESIDFDQKTITIEYFSKCSGGTDEPETSVESFDNIELY